MPLQRAPTLFAALSVLEGTVIGQCMVRHRHQEFIRFLNKINRETAAGQELWLIVDNYASRAASGPYRAFGIDVTPVFHPAIPACPNSFDGPPLDMTDQCADVVIGRSLEHRMLVDQTRGPGTNAEPAHRSHNDDVHEKKECLAESSTLAAYKRS